MPWLSIATAFLKLAGALMDYAQRKNYIRQGELQAFHEAAQGLANSVREARKAVIRVRVDDEYRNRLREKYSQERVLRDSADTTKPPTV
jgi:hypothetical protein|tara:strand:+ start:2897 stop:3163 length:267 start_codon:yes stop_codon:yes gene_type:complete